ncbi:hypothetical protein QBC38DRAFT_460082 [Podospora fimiseda]|uniref:Uncharacterized protein n=1 Tax=Podospora fimiseda TaxID=252190 RepID=A0AAN6YPU2_9PEZI|nr:hypothetical protein QBC38DRAFT_460082 [Podospora fimiseda]
MTLQGNNILFRKNQLRHLPKRLGQWPETSSPSSTYATGAAGNTKTKIIETIGAIHQGIIQRFKDVKQPTNSTVLVPQAMEPISLEADDKSRWATPTLAIQQAKAFTGPKYEKRWKQGSYLYDLVQLDPNIELNIGAEVIIDLLLLPHWLKPSFDQNIKNARSRAAISNPYDLVQLYPNIEINIGAECHNKDGSKQQG